MRLRRRKAHAECDLQTAQALGLAIPQHVLQATEVIQ
jgi:hypothetical protein